MPSIQLFCHEDELSGWINDVREDFDLRLLLVRDGVATLEPVLALPPGVPELRVLLVPETVRTVPVDATAADPAERGWLEVIPGGANLSNGDPALLCSVVRADEVPGVASPTPWLAAMRRRVRLEVRTGVRTKEPDGSEGFDPDFGHSWFARKLFSAGIPWRCPGRATEYSPA